MSLNHKIIALFVAEDYEDLEVWYPYLRLKEAGVDISVLASDNVKGDIVYSKHDYPIKVNKKAKDVNPEKFDGVIIPGGWAPDKLRRCNNTLNFVKYMEENNKLIASICHGGWVLASADVIEGKSLTSTIAIKDDLINAGAVWLDKEVVIDGNFISSRSPKDLTAFLEAIIKKLKD
ncbi:MAG: type 1 glutamine amidotransferase [Halanaerobiales bacterium]|nr:type 1 glutamine amidotransferase [Halanaerobiales bacterium]